MHSLFLILYNGFTKLQSWISCENPHFKYMLIAFCWHIYPCFANRILIFIMADVYFRSEYIFSVICCDLTFLQMILSFYAFFLSMSVFILQLLSNPKFFTPDVFHFCFSHLFNLQTSLYSFTFLLSYITSSFQLRIF